MAKKSHGMYKTKVYHAWESMLQRCLNPKHPSYKSYGGRGISVCGRWKVFANFLEDMGEPSSIELSLDRVDNSKGYCKENCRWTDQKTQAHNSRRTKLLTHEGVTDSCRGWGSRVGVTNSTIAGRLKRGYSAADAITKAKWEHTKCRKLEYKGKCLTVREWATELNININTLKSRMKQGWETSKILDPKQHKKERKNA